MKSWMKTFVLAAIGLTLLGSSATAADIKPMLDSSVLITNGKGHGSGVLIAPDKVLTAKHVTDNDDLRIVTRDGGIYEIASVVADPNEDTDLSVATLKKPVIYGVFAHVGCRLPEVAEPIHYVGNPGKARGWYLPFMVAKTESDKNTHRMYLTGNTVVGGASGGPVFDKYGDVLGVMIQTIGDIDKGKMKSHYSYAVVQPTKDSIVCQGS